ncbi:DNA-directed RNA polymerase III subunit RPC4 [Euwallacea similis]|uniref:DNA-directed RNA polymerase III subunit RPC4 n=1 Tax=Euwallacea similis TaxID=1736056 RepID=UPI00344C978D
MERGPERRLQSLKLPRDLTLGGTKPKKTFAPNLNAARSKKSKDLFIKSEDKWKGNQRKDGRNNKKIVPRTERFIQSSGIFSQGIGSDALKKIRCERERAYSSRDDTISHTVPVPKIKKGDWQADSKTEARVYEDIMADNSLMEDEDDLSFSPMLWNESDLKEHKVFTVNKLEPKSEEENSLKLDKLKIELGKNSKQFEEADRFSDYNPDLTLWKLPDSFAGKGLSDDPKDQTCRDYKLGEMLEGQIGKMRFRQSGKIEVFIGCMKYQIEASQLESFPEKIVAIDTKSPQSNSVVLGKIQNRYVLNPDWNVLLKES